MTSLQDQLKRLIVDALNLERVKPSDIIDDEPLFGGGLGLDSIDVLELAVAVERHFNVKIPDEAIGKAAFASVNALAEFVREARSSG